MPGYAGGITHFRHVMHDGQVFRVRFAFAIGNIALYINPAEKIHGRQVEPPLHR
jgi:hypothetical protein